MNKVKLLTKKDDSREEKPEKIDKNKEKSSGDIHKISKNQIVPTRAPSEIEQDISPGIQTQED